MLWFLLSLISAFLTATYSILIKKNVKKIDEYILAGFTLLLGSLMLFFVSLTQNIPKINFIPIISIISTALLNSIAIIFYFKALKFEDISLTIPFISLTPLFLLFTSYIMLKETPSIQGVAGISLLVLGAYSINFKKKEKIFRPFCEIIRNKGILLMMGAAFIWSISANLYKLAIITSDIIFAITLIYFIMGIILLCVSILKRKDIKLIKEFEKNKYKFLLLSILLILSDIAIAISFTYQIVPYVISIKRMSILFSVIYGAIVFREKVFIHRFISALLMVMGSICITLSTY